MMLRVSRGIPSDWDRWVADDRVGTTRRSMELTIDRYGDGYRTFALHDDGEALVAIGGTVLHASVPNRRSDPHHILAGTATDVGLAVAGPHPWAGLAPDDVLPGLMIMHPHYDTRPVGPAAGDQRVLDRFVEALLDWADDHGVRAVSFLYQTAAARPLLRSLSATGTVVVPLSSACVLDVTWPDFDGYLDGLGYKRRTAIRRELRWLAERQVTVAVEPLDRAGDELLDLRCALVAKYGGTPRRAKEQRLLELVRTGFAPEETCLVTARVSGRLLSFMLFVREGDDWSAVLTGSDYRSPDTRFTYFATGFYHPAALAPAAGIRRIHYGFGSWQAKQLRGCRAEPVWAAGLLLADRLAARSRTEVETSDA